MIGNTLGKTMTAVGDKRILATQTLLLSDDEVGAFDLLVGDTSLPVRVRFTSPEDAESSSRWQLDRGVLTFEFTGWSNPMGTGFKKAQMIGDLQGVPLGFNVAHQRLGDLNSATFQFYLGGVYG